MIIYRLFIQHIDYAKTKSFATLRNEDPNFVAPTAANASALISQSGKRPRDSDAAAERPKKREKGDDSDEEMEIEDEEEPPQGKEVTCTSLYPISEEDLPFNPKQPTQLLYLHKCNSPRQDCSARIYPKR